MLEVRGLDARYGDAQALWDIDIDVAPGETVCIVGPNGAGKTTLVHTIAGLHPAAAGSIRVGGVDVAPLPGHKVCAHGVATVPEGRRVFGHMTVRDNLLLGAYRKAARPVHRQTEAEVYRLFPRLAERAGQAAGALSGGEQQMVAIGRALMARPRLLLLDEPSLGLAPLIVRQIFEAIRRIAHEEGVTIFLVEQNAFHALRLADRGYVLVNGRVRLSGTGRELLANREVRAAYLEGGHE